MAGEFDMFNILTDDAIIRDSLEINEVEDMDKKEEEQQTQEEETLKDKRTDASKSKSELEIKDLTAEEKKEEESDNEQEQEDDSLTVFAKYLHEKGIVDLDEEFEPTDEGLENLIEKRIEKEINQYKSSLGDLSLKFVEFVENGGNPKDFLESFKEVDYSKVDLVDLEDDESLQRKTITELLLVEGYTPEEIREELEDYESAGILYNKAKRAITKLAKVQEENQVKMVETQKQQRVEQEKQYKEFLVGLEDSINKKEEILGMKLNDRTKKEFFKYITDVNPKTGKTKIIEDSTKDPESQLKMAWLYFNNFDLSKVEKTVKTKVSSSLRDKLANINTEGKGRGATNRSKTTDAVTGDFSLFRKVIN